MILMVAGLAILVFSLATNLFLIRRIYQYNTSQNPINPKEEEENESPDTIELFSGEDCSSNALNHMLNDSYCKSFHEHDLAQDYIAERLSE